MHSAVIAAAVTGLVLVFGAGRTEEDVPSAPPVDAVTARGAATHDFAATLSRTEYFADVVKLEIGEGFTPYRVNVTPWSDGAFKQRFMRLPRGRAAHWKADGAWEFPVGTVFLQNVVILLRDLRLRRLETRVIVVKEDGLAFATYVWREDHTDADLVEDGGRIDIETETSFQRWDVVPTAKCTECHESDAQPLLGLSTKQLNLEHGDTDQLGALAARGLVRGLPRNRAELPRLVDPGDESRSLDERARSYLDVNCSSCHRPGGHGSGTMDLRFDTPRAKSGLGELHEIVLDGRPFDSWIYLRMIYTNGLQMPSELTTTVDRKGADLIRAWVESKKSS